MTTTLGMSSLTHSTAIDTVAYILASSEEDCVRLFVILLNGFVKTLSWLPKSVIVLVINLLCILVLLVLVHILDRLY